MDENQLRKEAWHGLERKKRFSGWMVLLKILPFGDEQQWPLLVSQYRASYAQLLRIYLPHQSKNRISNMLDNLSSVSLTTDTKDCSLLRQIKLDVPRSGLIELHGSVRDALVRILYVWSCEHPEIGYIQGMNDLLLAIAYTVAQSNGSNLSDPIKLDMEDKLGLREGFEADAYQFFAAMMATGLQEWYRPPGQRALQSVLSRLRTGMRLAFPLLLQHLDKLDITVGQWAFRWMNCLLCRELGMECVLRIWDAYASEYVNKEEPFGAQLHIYVCMALIGRFEEKICATASFEQAMLLLQKLPVHDWTPDDIGLLLAEAFVLRSRFPQ